MWENLRYQGPAESTSDHPQGRNTILCGLCGKLFIRKISLVAHHHIHTGDEPYKCEQCGKVFSRTDRLRAHQKTHSEEKPHSCEQCGKTFKLSRYLKQHKKTHSSKPAVQRTGRIHQEVGEDLAGSQF
ncbi:hypothetical protein CCH79_00019321 [Gambusia affinis]|uniref:C2H2-type domain-containing protein n=1 Tax=Gambusia affinis TaxID=33528 RepID=A0A315WA31_GAMAF|nr:hypothetical protein CCH79_00019321 [Gambusia affinis]